MSMIAGVVQVLCNHCAPPFDLSPFATHLSFLESCLVEVRNDDNNRVSLLDLVCHPPEPTLSGRLFVLVEARIDPLGSQAIGESQHPL